MGRHTNLHVISDVKEARKYKPGTCIYTWADLLSKQWVWRTQEEENGIWLQKMERKRIEK
jgi:hypothetical protein